MSEGPQVKLRAEWLDRYLAGRTTVRCQAARPYLREAEEQLSGRKIECCFCKGKHIFIRFEGGLHLHNHLLMRGRWRKLSGQLLFLPPGVWLGLYMGPYTVCNLNGQMLELADERAVTNTMNRLGPDCMAEPYPDEAIREALSRYKGPIAEGLLDQSMIAGVGNVAKSEALYLAGVDPEISANALGDVRLAHLSKAIDRVMRDSYASGGRWTHRVYRRAGRPCPGCGSRVRSLRLPPSRRATYYCPSCQR